MGVQRQWHVGRDSHALLWMEQGRQDIRHALRALSRVPGFTAAAVLTLALCIGANTAVFSVVNAVLIRPLAFPDPDRIVQFFLTSSGGATAGSSIPDLRFWLEHADCVQDIAAYDFDQSSVGLTSGIPEVVRGVHVTANYFRLFGAPFLIGRGLSSSEDRAIGPKVVVLSYGLWKGRFGADVNIIGKTIPLNTEPYTVVGVTGESFHSQPDAQLWIPFQMNLNSEDQGHSFAVAARLKPGITLTAANAQLDAALQAARHVSVLPDPDFRFQLRPLHDSMVSGIRSSLLILQGAVALILLIGCANLANLVRVRTTVRRGEFAIRAALGASSGPIVRQLITESFLLCCCGCLSGVVCGFLAVNALLYLAPGTVRRITEVNESIGLDWRVLAFAVALSILTGLASTMLPAWSLFGNELSSALQESGGRQGSGVRSRRSNTAIVVSEVALSLTLFIGAALLLRTFYLLNNINPGFDSHHVLAMNMPMGTGKPESATSLSAMVQKARERLAAIPGVEASAATFSPPFASRMGLPFTATSGTAKISGDGEWIAASPGYFDVLKIPILRGRQIDSRDRAGSSEVVMINQTMATRYWPWQNAIGQQITIGGGLGPGSEDHPRTIIGIFADTRDTNLSEEPEPTMVVPDAQQPDGLVRMMSKFGPIYWIVRTRVVSREIMPKISKEVTQSTSGRPVGNIQTIDEMVARSIAEQRFDMLLLVIFAAVALVLAGVGVYGVMAYSVAQRRHEIGVRMALGASRTSIRNMVLREGLINGLMGIVLGTLAAFFLSRLLAGLLYGVSVHDLAIFTAALLFLEIMTGIAAFLPAQKAAGLDPLKALRFQ